MTPESKLSTNKSLLRAELIHAMDSGISIEDALNIARDHFSGHAGINNPNLSINEDQDDSYKDRIV